MLNKLNYIPMKTKITSENLNEIQDEIIKNSLDLQNFESQLESNIANLQAQIDELRKIIENGVSGGTNIENNIVGSAKVGFARITL